MITTRPLTSKVAKRHSIQPLLAGSYYAVKTVGRKLQSCLYSSPKERVYYTIGADVTDKLPVNPDTAVHCGSGLNIFPVDSVGFQGRSRRYLVVMFSTVGNTIVIPRNGKKLRVKHLHVVGEVTDADLARWANGGVFSTTTIKRHRR